MFSKCKFPAPQCSSIACKCNMIFKWYSISWRLAVTINVLMNLSIQLSSAPYLCPYVMYLSSSLSMQLSIYPAIHVSTQAIYLSSYPSWISHQLSFVTLFGNQLSTTTDSHFHSYTTKNNKFHS